MSCSPVYSLKDFYVTLLSVQSGGFGCHARYCKIWRIRMSRSLVYNLEDVCVMVASAQCGGFWCHAQQCTIWMPRSQVYRLVDCDVTLASVYS